MSDSFQDRLARLNAGNARHAPPEPERRALSPEPKARPTQPGKLIVLGLAATLLLPSVLGVGYIVLTQSMQTALIAAVDDISLPEAAKRGFASDTIESNAQIMMLLARGEA